MKKRRREDTHLLPPILRMLLAEKNSKLKKERNEYEK